jgi:excisionase family DNA binding protein
MLRLTEVAELLSVSRTKVYELVASGEIPSLHLGRSRRVPLRALREWVDQQIALIAQVRAEPAKDQRPTGRTVAHPAQSRRKRAARSTPVAVDEDVPFFQPWMPYPMKKAEYRAWVGHLEEHPEEKARVIEAMERQGSSR